MSRPIQALLFASLIGVAACAGASARVETAPPNAPPKRTASLEPPITTSTADATPPQAPTAHEPEPTPEAVPIAGTEFVRGRATVTVNAPIDKVRESVLGFAAYPEFMPHYETCKVLGRTPAGAREVYMGIEALHGAVHMWAQIQVPKAVIVDGAEVYDTVFEKGNVDDFKASWRIKKIDPGTTELTLEVFMKPSIGLPTKLVNSENLKGAVKGVVAMKARSEGRKLADAD